MRESIMAAVNEALDDLDNQIGDLQDKRSLLAAFVDGTKELSPAQQWVNIRGTSMRMNEAEILKIAEEMIPGGTRYEYGVNEITIFFDDVFVQLPTKESDTITLGYKGPVVHKYPEATNPCSAETRYRLMAELEQSNPSTIEVYTRANRDLRIYEDGEAAFKRMSLFTAWQVKRQMKRGYYTKKYEMIKGYRLKIDSDRLTAYNDFMNAVSKFEALNYHLVKEFAGNVFKIDRGPIWQ